MSVLKLYNPKEMMSLNLPKAKSLTTLTAVFLALLLVKFLLPLFLYDLPLGYDPGIYRYLFVKHAEGFPPFALANMDGWAYTHPLGLFMFSSVLLRLGIPVDWLVGWMWNVMAIVLIYILASVTVKHEGKAVGACVLLMGVLSAPYYDGFSAMYWKAYLALLFVVVALYLIDQKSWWAVVPGTLALITHNQTGLLFALVMGTWWLILGVKHWKDPVWRKATGAGALFLCIAALAYLPVWQESIWMHVKSLLTLRGENVPAGSFPPAMFYFKWNALLLLVGAYGFIRILLRDRKLTPWSLAVLWAAAFVFLKLFFYKRFFLHFDFFLLPFAAYGLVNAWGLFSNKFWRVLIIILIIIQGYLSYQVFEIRGTDIDNDTFALITSLAEAELPEDAYIITLENKSTTWLRGWLPNYRVGGPGLFNLNWSYEQWVELIYGTHADRKAILEQLDGPAYFLLTPLFYEHYGESAESFVRDSCFQPLEYVPLLQVTCI